MISRRRRLIVALEGGLKNSLLKLTPLAIQTSGQLFRQSHPTHDTALLACVEENCLNPISFSSMDRASAKGLHLTLTREQTYRKLTRYLLEVGAYRPLRVSSLDGVKAV